MTFQEPESARRACVDPAPVIDGRRANCNLASLGRPQHALPLGKESHYSITSIKFAYLYIRCMYTLAAYNVITTS